MGATNKLHIVHKKIAQRSEKVTRLDETRATLLPTVPGHRTKVRGYNRKEDRLSVLPVLCVPLFVHHTKMSRGRHWVFTLNNPEGAFDWELLSEHLRYLVYQSEVGENGTHHFQGYFQTKKPERITSLKKKFDDEAHIEFCRDPKKAQAYAMKEDTRVEGPWEYGKAVFEHDRTDLVALKSDLDEGKSLSEVAGDHFALYLRYGRYITEYKSLQQSDRNEAPKVVVIIGPPGSGKSSRVRSLHPDQEVYAMNPDTLWWDGYENQSVVVIEEYCGQWKYEYLLQLLDRYPMRVQVKGSTRKFNSPYIYITSNVSIDSWYRSVDYLALYRRLSEYWTVRDNRYVNIIREVLPGPPPLIPFDEGLSASSSGSISSSSSAGSSVSS